MTPFLAHEFRGLFLSAAATLILILSAELWRRFGHPAVETTRKLVHFGTGCICLLFPVLFTSHWSVLVLAVSFVGLMWSSKRWQFLPSIHAVDRSTEGGVYYPIAVWITFAMAQSVHRMEFYAAAILVLAVGDAVAALVGTRYGTHRFQVEEGRRSFEGSVMFFLAAFTIIHLILNLASDFGKTEAALSSLYLATILTVLEGISISGTDNLWIPIGTTAILINVSAESIEFLRDQTIALVVMLVFTVLILSRHRKLGFAPRVGLGLLIYSSHAFHGLSWSVPFLVAITLVSLGTSTSVKLSAPTRVRPVFLCILPVLGWILAAQYLSLSDTATFPAFATSIGGCIVFLWNRSHPKSLGWRSGRALVIALFLAISHTPFDAGSQLIPEGLGIAAGSFLIDVTACKLRPLAGSGSYRLLVFTATSTLTSLGIWLLWRLLP